MTNKTDSDQNIDIARTLGLDHSSVRSKRLKRLLFWAIPALLMIITASYFLIRNGANTVKYKTQEAQRDNLTIMVTATGNLEPTNQVDVGIEVSGTIKTVEVDYNDRVKVDQVLARLDTTKLKGQVLQAKAVLESAYTKVRKAEAKIKEAGNQLKRLRHVQKLSGGKVPSQAELDAEVETLQVAQAEEASAKAAVSEARANFNIRNTDLSKAVIRSPVNGIVLLRNVEPGQTVAASLQTPVLFTLAEDLKLMQLHVDVDEADVGQVQAGQDAVFTVDAYPNRSFTAKVTEVRFAPKTVEGVVTYETLLTVDNSDLSLRPGMTATADIIVKRIKDVVLVPNTALRFIPPVKQHSPPKGGGGLLSAILPRRPPREYREKPSADISRQRVWKLMGGKLVAVNITIGATDGRMTEVVKGDIEPGLPLVVDTRSSVN
ncbi:MAG: efflux transporter periplasmic adaptor subunit [Desulfobacteraceae bacterium 4484_190.1]|nr:MAG: efflux transporter periplasmic adaptor subunit [Desulfobacteraceae bacterium 4484_190.1]